MPSSLNDLIDINIKHFSNVHVLHIDKSDFITFFNNLKTSTHKLAVPNHYSWDLPLKRNYAIWFSIKEGFRKILLVDDDIVGIDSHKLDAGAYLLDKYTAVGSFVEDYPDTSIIGHTQLNNGDDFKCFLSGSFLFISPFEINNFFPKLYNEDWVFMTPLLLNNKICTFGEIMQKPYDPFFIPEKATFQEYGEIIAEGLFALLDKKEFNLRYDNCAWDEIIERRRNQLLELQKSVKCDIQKSIISKALLQNSKILPCDCTDYMYSLDEDRLSWKLFLEEIL